MIDFERPNENENSEVDVWDDLALLNLQKRRMLVDFETGMRWPSESVVVVAAKVGIVWIDFVILIIEVICVFDLS